MGNIPYSNLESLSISCLEKEISHHSNLKSELSRGDKYPFWDGEILYYKKEPISQKAHSNKNFCIKIPIQVKSKEVKNVRKTKTNYSIKKTAIEAYIKDGGLLYFVVLCNNQEQQIYYKMLLPVDLHKLHQKMRTQQTISITLTPLEPNALPHICSLFDSNRPKQQGRSPVHLSTINSKGEISGSFSPLNPHISFLDNLFQGTAYAYLHDVNGFEVPIDFDSVYAISATNTYPVSTKGKVYYDSVKLTRTADSSYVEIPEVGTVKNKTLKVSLSSYLNKAIYALEFLIESIKNGEISFGVGYFTFNNDSKMEKFKQHLQSELKEKRRLRNIFNSIGVNCDIDMSKISEDQLRAIESIGALNIDGIPYKVKSTNSCLQKLSIGGEFALLFASFKDSKATSVRNLFALDILDFVHFSAVDENDVRYETHPYGILEAEDLFALNFDATAVYSIINKIDVNPVLMASINNLLVQVLLAYDIDPVRRDFIDLAEKLADMLVNFAPEDLHFKINRLQTMKRIRNLFLTEKMWLMDLQKSTPDLILKCAALLLLDELTEFEPIYINLDDGAKEDFIEWPIYSFYKNHFLGSDRKFAEQPAVGLLQDISTNKEQV